MNIEDTPDQASFRREVKDWIDKEIPSHLKGFRQGVVQGPGIDKNLKDELEKVHEIKGWLAPGWPKEFGGGGFDISQMVIFQEECTQAGVPLRHTVGVEMLGPILMHYGTEAQRAKFLGPTMTDEIGWAQGYSEPASGSDLASLSMKAEIKEDGFLLNGQKIWTSRAHVSDWIFMLVRTDFQAPKKQMGITFLLVDLKTPGIEINPVLTIDGYQHFCETFFTNVFVPKDQMVGTLNQGWTVAKALLGHERFTHPTADPYVIGRALDNLKEDCRNTTVGDGTLWDNKRIRSQVAALEMDMECMRFTRYRALTKVQQGEAPGPETMIFKLFGAELTQKIIDLHQELMGPMGTAWKTGPLSPDMTLMGEHSANIRAATLRGGTSEVQRNIISKRVLQLPGG